MEPFYKIISQEQIDGKSVVRVSIDGAHVIYEAHFPGHPITPGAMLIELAAQIVAADLHIDTDIKEAKNVKFLLPHHPQEHEQLTLSFDAGQNPVEVTITDGDETFARMTLQF
ncbi:MAG: hypothetical protein K6E86_01220 [Bacteroidales bacterium]|nr:hypothetical protein [Bacteroidales bacterium]